ncbi:MAG: FmdB family zinc ribbon protein [Pseudolysinimonas sp.]
MPTYSYRCTECGEAFDIQQAFTDDTLSVCPNCGGQLRKLFTAVGVSFNGSGFYRTDSRAKPTPEGGGTSSDSSSSSDSSGSSPSTSATPASAAPAAGAKKESKARSSAKE